MLNDNQSIIYQLQNTINDYVSDFKEADDILPFYKKKPWLHHMQYFMLVQTLYSAKISLALQKEVIKSIMPDLISDINLPLQYNIHSEKIAVNGNNYAVYIVDFYYNSRILAHVNLFVKFKLDKADELNLSNYSTDLSNLNKEKQQIQAKANFMQSADISDLYDAGKVDSKFYLKYSLRPKKWNQKKADMISEYNHQISLINNQIAKLQNKITKLKSDTTVIEIYNSLANYAEGLHNFWKYEDSQSIHFGNLF